MPAKEQERPSRGELIRGIAATAVSVLMVAAAPSVGPWFGNMIEGFGLGRELSWWHRVALAPGYGVGAAVPVAACLFVGLRWASLRKVSWWIALGMAMAGLAFYVVALWEPLLAVSELLGP